MSSAEHHIERLVEELPGIESVPGFTDRSADRQLGIACLEMLHNLRAVTAQDLQLYVAEDFSQLADVTKNQTELDAVGYRELQRSDLAVVDHGRQCTRALRAVVALLEQREHALTQRGKQGVRPLAPKQVAAQFTFQELDGSGQRRLRNVAFLRGTREVERSRDRQEIPDLVHFHGLASGSRQPAIERSSLRGIPRAFSCRAYSPVMRRLPR